ncbi:MAG: hypothetical protein ACJAXN_000902 [Psychromonas sp.]|jgi:hypothetical protein
MSDFTEKIRLRGKAEEDIYFSKLNQRLVEALHQKKAQQADKESANNLTSNSEPEHSLE